MTMASNVNIIDTKDEGIVVKETPISISDEKLRNSLSRAYEEAQKDIIDKIIQAPPHLCRPLRRIDPIGNGGYDSRPRCGMRGQQ